MDYFGSCVCVCVCVCVCGQFEIGSFLASLAIIDTPTLVFTTELPASQFCTSASRDILHTNSTQSKIQHFD